MAIQIESSGVEGGVCAIDVAGELDHATAPELEQHFDRAIDGGVDRLVLDLSQCTFIDSTGLGAIVVAHQKLSEQGAGRLVICCPTDIVKRLFKLTALDEEIPLLGSRDEAIAKAGTT